jgi:hypothetical protein
MITQKNDNIIVDFKNFDADSYKIFLQSKKLPEYNLKYDWKTDSYQLKCPARFAHVFGMEETHIDKGWLPLADHLFDYQQFICKQALEIKRFAVWADTGLGKTNIYLEFARQVEHRTGRKVLLIVPLNIIPQTITEAHKFYGAAYQIERLWSRSDMKDWCKKLGGGIGIVNPEKFIPRNESEIISELQYLGGVILDEASLLKTGGGKIKWSLIKSCRGIEYKMSCTATPAPNEAMEYASQGSWLEKLRNEGDILWTYFTRKKDGSWKVKNHAQDAFYRFMSSWSVYLRNPINYGFADNLKDLPEPIITKYIVPCTKEQWEFVQAIPDKTGQMSLFINKGKKITMVERSKFSQLAKGFSYDKNGKSPKEIPSNKPAFIVDLIKKEVATGSQVLVWTVFNEECEVLKKLLTCVNFSIDVLSGKVPKMRRPDIIEKFQTGKTDVLISKASMLGFGLNFQNCDCMIFSGFNDSFEQFYQAVRRSYRYGQTKAVKIHIPYIKELEGTVWQNIERKQEQFIYDTTKQEKNYLAAMKGVLKNET